MLRWSSASAIRSMICDAATKGAEYMPGRRVHLKTPLGHMARISPAKNVAFDRNAGRIKARSRLGF